MYLCGLGDRISGDYMRIRSWRRGGGVLHCVRGQLHKSLRRFELLLFLAISVDPALYRRSGAIGKPMKLTDGVDPSRGQSRVSSPRPPND